MLLLIAAGLALAVLVLSALHWRWSRRAFAAARRHSERTERKLDALLQYLALDSELAEIDATAGGPGQSGALPNSLSSQPQSAARLRARRQRD